MKDRMKKISGIINLPTEKPNENGKIYSETAVQKMVKKMRKLNEEEESLKNRKTVYDQSREERNFRNNFDDLNVTVEFDALEVYDNFVFWGGTVDRIIQFAYKVTPSEDSSGIEFNYSDEFNADNPDNDEIVKRIKSYYDQFYKYWRDNVFQT